MSELTYPEYWAEVKSLAENMISETFEWLDDKAELTRDECFDATMDEINDHVLHETIDGHQWVIYYAYNLDVIKHSANEDYYADNFGGEALASSLESGLDTLHCHIAFWCLYADVADELAEHGREYFDEYLASLQPEPEALEWD